MYFNIFHSSKSARNKRRRQALRPHTLNKYELDCVNDASFYTLNIKLDAPQWAEAR